MAFFCFAAFSIFIVCLLPGLRMISFLIGASFPFFFYRVPVLLSGMLISIGSSVVIRGRWGCVDGSLGTRVPHFARRWGLRLFRTWHSVMTFHHSTSMVAYRPRLQHCQSPILFVIDSLHASTFEVRGQLLLSHWSWPCPAALTCSVCWTGSCFPFGSGFRWSHSAERVPYMVSD